MEKIAAIAFAMMYIPVVGLMFYGVYRAFDVSVLVGGFSALFVIGVTIGLVLLVSAVWNG